MVGCGGPGALGTRTSGASARAWGDRRQCHCPRRRRRQHQGLATRHLEERGREGSGGATGAGGTGAGPRAGDAAGRRRQLGAGGLLGGPSGASRGARVAEVVAQAREVEELRAGLLLRAGRRSRGGGTGHGRRRRERLVSRTLAVAAQTKLLVGRLRGADGEGRATAEGDRLLGRCLEPLLDVLEPLLHDLVELTLGELVAQRQRRRLLQLRRPRRLTPRRHCRRGRRHLRLRRHWRCESRGAVVLQLDQQLVRFLVEDAKLVSAALPGSPIRNGRRGAHPAQASAVEL
mmetsp:Transcript_116670/g.371169  ORF Transcript_116670/g.371169 Transcript_116670/m.371169 type:complete len:289 (+) Transcript_116670:168-1034(+)